MIKTRLELIEAMKKGAVLTWHIANKPSDPAIYTVDNCTRVHGNAANSAIKNGDIREIRHTWRHGTYRLT